MTAKNWECQYIVSCTWREKKNVASHIGWTTYNIIINLEKMYAYVYKKNGLPVDEYYDICKLPHSNPVWNGPKNKHEIKYYKTIIIPFSAVPINRVKQALYYYMFYYTRQTEPNYSKFYRRN